MNAKIQFSVQTAHDRRIGKLDVPYQKLADWLNFLVSPRQQAKILSAEQTRHRLTLYFQASDSLYEYLDRRCNAAEEALRAEDSLVKAS